MSAPPSPTSFLTWLTPTLGLGTLVLLILARSSGGFEPMALVCAMALASLAAASLSAQLKRADDHEIACEREQRELRYPGSSGSGAS